MTLDADPNNWERQALALVQSSLNATDPAQASALAAQAQVYATLSLGHRQSESGAAHAARVESAVLEVNDSVEAIWKSMPG